MKITIGPLFVAVLFVILAIRSVMLWHSERPRIRWFEAKLRDYEDALTKGDESRADQIYREVMDRRRT